MEPHLAHDSTAALVAATFLTESELFACLLDAPVRTASSLSELNQSSISEHSLTDSFFGFFESSCFDEFELPKITIENLRDVEDPADELDMAINDIEYFLEGLQKLKEEFARLMKSARTSLPDDGATDERIEEWENNPRYVISLDVAA